MPCCAPRTLLVLGWLVCANVHAADAAAGAAKKGSPAKPGNTLTLNGGKPTGTLTRDQLRQCLSQQKSIKEQDTEAAGTQTALEAQKADIARVRTELEKEEVDMEAERAGVDATKAEAVDAFNAKLAQYRQRSQERSQQHGALIDAYNAQLRPFNERVQSINATRQTWLGDCGDRSYDEADFYAIQRGK